MQQIIENFMSAPLLLTSGNKPKKKLFIYILIEFTLHIMTLHDTCVAEAAPVHILLTVELHEQV